MVGWIVRSQSQNTNTNIADFGVRDFAENFVVYILDCVYLYKLLAGSL